MENQELRLQLLQGGVSSLGGISSTEADDLRQENKRVKEENKELIKALVACQDEFAHMNEKMMLQDASAEKLKTKFKELLAELDVMIAKPEGSGRNELQDFKKKVSEVVEIQHNAEQTIMDHEISRADVSQRVPTDEEKIGRGNDDGDDDDDDDGSDDGDETTFDATHALKQNALATQLNELNKVLAQKEKLATAMYSNDEKLQEMKAKYENNVLTMEKQISTMLKEKDELFQQHKNTPNNDPANKIAEQRRKRIQELEQMITDLRKKVTEQQRAIKVNEKNAAQVKKLADEIQGMKAQKVKLIRQIKEDAEKVRVWKQQKEKEVMKLKQQERKAQVKMAKMETLHSKQQNVLRRKMEEAIVLNKRLKDVVDKQKASRAANAGKVHGLAGAGDRMRNWINEQMEVVVSVKEATQSREELMNDRKTLTKQLNDIKKSMRDTMTNEDMKALAIKTKELQDDLDLRNAQISNLQKQITDLEQDGRDNVSGAKKNRFEAVRSMTEAKIALEHLFEKNIEQTFNVTQMKSEFTELRHLYEEAVKNTNTLENEIAVLKNEHQSEFLRASREHEEKVLYLLSKLNDTNEGERLKVHELEINKFNKLHDELLKLSEDNEKLRQQVLTKGGDEKKEGNISKVKIEKPPPVKKVITYEDETDEDSIAEEDSDDENDRDDDPDWRKTPLFKRIKKLRETGGGSTFLAPPAQKLKRKISSDAEGGDDDEENGSTKPKRTSKSSGTSGCRCKEGCKTKRCRCKKNSGTCDTSCGCDPSQCKNRPGEAGNDTTGGDRSSLSDISNNDTANTMSLLNDTYTSGIVGSPSKKGRPSFFKSPITPEYEKSTLHPTKFNFSPSPN